MNINTFKNRLVHLTIALAVAGAALTGLLLPTSASAQISIRIGPPDLREEMMPQARRGYTWSEGHWEWRNRRHVWVRGLWLRNRSGYDYQQANWERNGDRWIMHKGQWNRNKQENRHNDNQGNGRHERRDH